MDAYRTFTHAFFDWDSGGRNDALAALDLYGIAPAIRDYQGALAGQYIAGVLNRVGLPEPQKNLDDPKSVQPYVLFSHAVGQIAIAPVGCVSACKTGSDSHSMMFAAGMVLFEENQHHASQLSNCIFDPERIDRRERDTRRR